jgi:diguanylate cyclase (GGDEF)-like protein
MPSPTVRTDVNSPSILPVHGAAPWADVDESTIITADMAADLLTQLELRHSQYVQSQTPLAERIVRVATQLDRSDLRRRAQLVIADATIRMGEVVAGSSMAREVEADAERNSDAFALARAHYQLAWASHTLGDIPEAQIHGIHALELLPADTPRGIVMDHLMIVAIAYNPSPQADAYFQEALTIAEECGDPVRTVIIHNNIAYAAMDNGDLETAHAHVALMLDLAERTCYQLPIVQLETAARLYNIEGRYRDAIDVLKPVEQMDRVLGPDDVPSDVRLPLGLLALARAWRGLRDWDTAQRHLDQARERATDGGMKHLLARILQEQAYLSADRGDFERAYTEHREYHDAIMALQSEEQRARARVVQATFDAERNRQQAEHFRQLAMRDALTGLFNRRYMDDLLIRAIHQSEMDGSPLSLAIIDADFFKRINDQLSHEVGDAVLRDLAAVLLSSKPADSTVCRLGGEEFVLLMPHRAADRAVEACDAVRRAVAEHDWSPLTGELTLTVSIGVATAVGGRTTPSAMLSDADRNLYAAKRSGRNRVMGDVR